MNPKGWILCKNNFYDSVNEIKIWSRSWVIQVVSYKSLTGFIEVSISWSITLFFTISVAFINTDFFINKLRGRGKGGGWRREGRVFIISDQIFAWNKIGKYIQNSFNKNKHIFINISIYESTVPIKHINSSSDNIGISILIMPDAAKIRWRKKNFLVKFCENGLVTRISI